MSTPPASDVKQRPESVSCSACGRPTWSESGLCGLCRGGVKPLPPPPPPLRREVVLDSEGRIAEDVACRGCGYNLRGLPCDGNCPECRWSIDRSIHGDALAYSDAKWLKRIAIGATLVFAGALACKLGILPVVGTALTIFEFLHAGPDVMTATVGLMQLAMAVLVGTGVWMLTTAEPGSVGVESWRSPRRLARWCVMAMLVESPLSLPWIHGLGPLEGTSAASLRPIYLVLGVLALIGELSVLVHLGRLVDRVPRARFRRETRAVAWTYGVVSALLMVAASGLRGVAFLPAGWMPRMHILHFPFLLASGFVLLVSGIWGLVVLGVGAGELRRISRPSVAEAAP